MAKHYNLARMTTATTGTGTITLAEAAFGFLTFADAGAQDGDIITYAIEDGANREIGRGTYAAAGTITRGVLKSTNGDYPLNLSGTAQIFIAIAAEDLTDAMTAAVVAPLAADFPGRATLRGTGTGGSIVLTDKAKGLSMGVTDTGGIAERIAYRTIPAANRTDFEFAARIVPSFRGSSQAAHICLGDANGNWFQWGMLANNPFPWGLHMAHGRDDQSNWSDDEYNDGGVFLAEYLKVVVSNGNDVSCYMSRDGENWGLLRTHTLSSASVGTPTRYGFGVHWYQSTPQFLQIPWFYSTEFPNALP